MNLWLDQPRPHLVNQANTVDSTLYSKCMCSAVLSCSLSDTACSVCTGCVPSINRRKMPHVGMIVECCCWEWLTNEISNLWAWYHPSLPCLHPFFSSLPLLLLIFVVLIIASPIPTLSPFFFHQFIPTSPEIFPPNLFLGFLSLNKWNKTKCKDNLKL